METHLDHFGRVVIPKNIRGHLGLQAGAAIDIIEFNQQIILKPVGKKAPVVKKDGLLIFRGTALGDIAGTLWAHRNDRIAKIAGDHSL